jgi:adenylate cyclase
MFGRTLPRIRLRVGIAVMFLGIMLPLTGMMTAVLYRQNSHLAFDMAETAMDSASHEVVSSIRVLLGQMARVVDTSVAFGLAERTTLRNVETLRPLLEQMEQIHDIYALFFAFAKDGAFYEVIRVPQDGRPFGAHDKVPPPEARYVLRIIDTVEGERVDSWIYLSKWGEAVAVERADIAKYDPRPRPWYKAALEAKGVATSGVHVFSSLALPGLTLSGKLATADGEVVGVFGADLTTRSLSRFLGEHIIGADGAAFILDEDDRLIGYTHPERAMVQDGDHVDVAKAEAVEDRVVADAVRLRRNLGDRYRAELGGKGETYLVAFNRFPDDFGKRWTIGVVGNESEFIGPLRRASLMIVLIGSIFLGLASFAVLWASRLLTRPIQALTEEADRIRRFDLEGEVAVHSAVTEIQTLASAAGAMKAALKSFGTYVPKDLVRGIVQSGTPTEVGGQRRQVTVLFTDLANFTGSSEAMPPEVLMERLSTYFQALSQTIEATGGIVDKFMGDGLMALWNAPALIEDHVARGCRAVLDARAATADFNAWLTAEGEAPLFTRFGLHTGTGVVGNVGARERMQYTALGASVNLASRVEGLNKRYATESLVTGEVEAAARGRFLFRPMGLVLAHGTSTPVELFELVGDMESDEPAARCAAWAEPFAVWRERDWAAAAAALERFLALYPEDGPARLLLAKAQEYHAAPPEAGWDGALRFDGK